MSEIKKNIEKSRKYLKDIFGFSNYRNSQEEIITNILTFNNVLSVMPTGAGKSLCYQLPATILKTKTIIISPLIALIDDQVNSLEQNNIKAEKLHSNQTKEETIRSWHNFSKGDCKILYISPERLMTEKMLLLLKSIDIGLFVIDEVHCVSRWGQSFRPDYEKLSQLKDIFPNATIAGFTATADKTTRSDIIEKIFNNKVKVFITGFDRPNLSLSIVQKSNWKKQLLNFVLKHKDESGIIYCLSRKTTEEVSEFLRFNGFKASSYHAGIEKNIRKKTQDQFMTEIGRIIVATVAFGMGIDKPDIRFVVHVNLPGSMEEYYQEIGRAGRDGLPSETLLIYGLDDLVLRRKMIQDSYNDQEKVLRENKRLDYLLSYCESPECRRKTLLNYFDDKTENCDNCDNCINPPKLVDGTELAQKLMSTIYRTGQFFGQVHIINVLRGSEDQKVLEKKHNLLSVYGIGKDKSKSFWQSFLRQMLAFGHLEINFQKFGAIKITESGMLILKNKNTYLFRQILIDKIFVSNPKQKTSDHNLSNKDEDLLILLKQLRLKLAKEQKVPAYIIFNDVTLSQIAKLKPINENEFLKIDGVGPAKLKKFGNIFIKTVKNKL